MLEHCQCGPSRRRYLPSKDERKEKEVEKAQKKNQAFSSGAQLKKIFHCLDARGYIGIQM